MVAGLLLLGPALSSVEAQAPAKNQRWEYAQLLKLAGGAVNGQPKTFAVSFIAAGKRVDAKSCKDLAQRLGKAKADDSIIEVLNLLGANGWELVTSDQATIRQGKGEEEVLVLTNSYILKRAR